MRADEGMTGEVWVADSTLASRLARRGAMGLPNGSLQTETKFLRRSVSCSLTRAALMPSGELTNQLQLEWLSKP